MDSHAAITKVATAADRGRLYNAGAESARLIGLMKDQSNRVSVPNEAHAFRDSVVTALRRREDTLNKFNEMLDRRSASTEGAYQNAQRAMNQATIQFAAELHKLCGTMRATPDECNAAVGYDA